MNLFDKIVCGRLLLAAVGIFSAVGVVVAATDPTTHHASERMTARSAFEKSGHEATFAINQGIAGAWFEMATAGQGFLIDIEPESSFIFIAWFNFESAAGAKVGAPEQRWLTAQGSYDGLAAVDLPIYSTSGGIFDTGQPTVTERVGTLTISFDSCTSGTVDYNLNEGLAGTINLDRGIPGSQKLCEALTGPTVEAFFTEPVPLNETPLLPGDACASPPGQLGLMLDNGIANQRNAATASAAELLDPSRITVVTCGTGSPAPSDRVQSCTAVFVGGQYLLFDAGDGASGAIEDLLFPNTQMNAIFLTHFHSDHIADVGEVASRSWINGRTEPLPIYGGPVVERVVEGFNLVYSPDVAYRVAHHGETVFPADNMLVEARRIENIDAAGQIIYDVDGVVVKAYGVDHSPISPALGYRVEYRGHAVGISGDTIETPGFRELARGADVLVSEVIDLNFALEQACAFDRAGDQRNAAIFRDIRTYHTGVREVAQLSIAASVATLMLTHFLPPLPFPQSEQLYRPQIAPLYSGNLIVSEDGSRVVIEVGDD